MQQAQSVLPAQRVPPARRGLKVLKERRALLVLPVPQVLRVRLDRAIRARRQLLPMRQA